MRRLLSTLLLATTLHLYAADSGASADSLVKNTSSDIISALNAHSYAAGDKRLLDLVENKALPNFDFTRITAQAVGKHWRDASPDQQASLVREFKALLVRTYTSALTSTKIKSIDVKPAQADNGDDRVLVRTSVNQASGQSVAIDYRMLKTADGWKVYDVAVEGVSLVTNYRTDFNQTVQKGGIDGLVKALIARNNGGK
ncbi:ABC transporter substrate-binding protein [Burkholderiaceae bacterium DAT-1]|nr:ABC transporter substrate-binding protein [Burkholderiaceae bacterium DAT-1]